MSEKRNGAFLFLVLLLFGTFFHTTTLAETSGEDRLVVFEVFRNYADTDELDDGLSATFQSGDAIEFGSCRPTGSRKQTLSAKP